jgi:hypothetical protein
MSTRYDVIAPRTYKDRDGNDKTSFNRVGVAFPMKDRDGFNLTLEALPLQELDRDGRLVCRLMLMPPREQGDTPSRPAERRAAAPAPDMNDDIPF